MPKLLYHDDGCKALLDDCGRCPACGYCPDMQSLGIKELPDKVIEDRLDKGEKFMDPYRNPIPARAHDDVDY